MKKIIFAKWKVAEADTPHIMKMLPELAEKTRSEEGAISYAIYQSESDPNEFLIHEQYVDAVAEKAHRQSEHYQRIVVNEIIPHLEVREVVRVTRLI